MSRPSLANWNGQLMPLSEVRVSVLDRAYLFGDGVYEVFRVYRGQPFLARPHFDRLRDSLAEIRITADVVRIESRVYETLKASGVQEGQVYLQISRGEAPRNHAFPNPPVPPNELIYVREYDDDPYAEARAQGIRALVVPDLRWKRCDIKSLNLLGNVLASQAAAEAGCGEAIMHLEGAITEGSHSTVFGVREGAIITTPLEANILPGITRSLVVRLADRLGIPVVQESMTVGSLATYDELFVTSTIAEVLSVIETIGAEFHRVEPGPIARRLEQAYREFVERGAI
ncbi:MAG: hypothetical protein DWH91_18390 [Planctomycetota bacterium]|nr:MAG: hypothetical protein DWH91_18390 [Planctomycetota bacterium]